MDLPEEKGTYVLIASVPQMRRIEIGRLGRFDIIPGHYVYVGSAFGSGGLRARLGHHLESTAEPHWHIDYLLQVAQLVEIWYTTADRKLEHHWADLLKRPLGSASPSPGSAPRTIIAPAQATCFTPSDALPFSGFGNSSQVSSLTSARRVVELLKRGG